MVHGMHPTWLPGYYLATRIVDRRVRFTHQKIPSSPAIVFIVHTFVNACADNGAWNVPYQATRLQYLHVDNWA